MGCDNLCVPLFFPIFFLFVAETARTVKNRGVGDHFFKEKWRKKGENANAGHGKNALAAGIPPFLFTLSFFFFLLRSGHMPGRQQDWRICVNNGKKAGE